jgi:hypothetical protein
MILMLECVSGALALEKEVEDFRCGKRKKGRKEEWKIRRGTFFVKACGLVPRTPTPEGPRPVRYHARPYNGLTGIIEC